MKRVIEDLIAQRKVKQEKLKRTLEEIADQFCRKGYLKKKKPEISKKIDQFSDDLNELITAQDREWDAYVNNHAAMVFKSLEWKITKLEAEYSHCKTLLGNFLTLEKSLQNLIKEIEGQTDKDSLARVKVISNQLAVYQYSDFEQRFRGDESQIKDKLRKYLRWFADRDHILDIGCGRGEFLELLAESGKQAEGIDISDSMLKQAEEKGVNCHHRDALHYLKEKKDVSLGGVFSSQVIEHFTASYLKEIVAECHRVLKPGSPLVFETINPLSLFALSRIFFLDVTHQRPLHPEYLRYLIETAGFDRVDILYGEELENEKLLEIGSDRPNALEFNTNVDRLNQILFSSQVYAVKGIKT